MNHLQNIVHVMGILDAPGFEGHVPPLWSEKPTIEQHEICEVYLRSMPEQQCDDLRERAARAYYNIIARDMANKRANDGWVLA